MTNKYYYNDNEVIALYRGDNLIYSRPDDEYPDNMLVAKYSSPGTYTLHVNDVEETITTDDNGYYTRIFDEPLTSCKFMFRELNPSAVNSVETIIRWPDMSQVTDMSFMFYNCKKLTNIDFSGCDLSQVTSMSNMFNDCRILTSVILSGIDTPRLITIGNFLSFCDSITDIDVSSLNLSNVSMISSGFVDNCNNLVSIHFGDSFDLSHLATFIQSWFIRNCPKLTTVTGSMIIGGNINVSAPLTNESAMVFINGLMNTTKNCTITFSSTTYNSLTTDQIAIATGKGWTVASA